MIQEKLEGILKEIHVEKGISIWGDNKCGQCGACCYEYHQHLFNVDKYIFKGEEGRKETCENFSIKDGKAYCSAHEGERPQICKDFFCGDIEFEFRFAEKRDKILRSIAEKLGTAPKEYKVPVLFNVQNEEGK